MPKLDVEALRPAETQLGTGLQGPSSFPTWERVPEEAARFPMVTPASTMVMTLVPPLPFVRYVVSTLELPASAL